MSESWKNEQEIINWIGEVNENNFKTNLYFLLNAINKLDKYEELLLDDLNKISGLNASGHWQYLGVIYQNEHDELKKHFFSYKSNPTRIQINVDKETLKKIHIPTTINFKHRINLSEPNKEHWKIAFNECIKNKKICGRTHQQKTKCELHYQNNQCPIKCVGRLAYAIANNNIENGNMLHPYIFNSVHYRNKFPSQELNQYIIECDENSSNLIIDEEKQLENNNLTDIKQIQPLNQILYGPPGTGKTYNTINKALEIIFNQNDECSKNNEDKNKKYEITYKKENCETEIKKVSYQEAIDNNDRTALNHIFEEYKKVGQIEFVTFHQSYGYEEFVEGIKAETKGENITYEVKPGIFKKLCERAKINDNFDEIYTKFLDDLNEENTKDLETKQQKKKFKIFRNTSDSIVVKPYTDKATEMLITKKMIQEYLLNNKIIDIM